MAPLPGGGSSETLACRYMSVLRYTTGADCTRSFKWRGSLQGGLPALVRLLRRPAQQNFKVHASGRLLKPLGPAAQGTPNSLDRQRRVRDRKPGGAVRQVADVHGNHSPHAPDRSHIWVKYT